MLLVQSPHVCLPPVHTPNNQHIIITLNQWSFSDSISPTFTYFIDPGLKITVYLGYHTHLVKRICTHKHNGHVATFSSRLKSHMITFSKAGAIALSSYFLFTRLSVTNTLHFLLHKTPKEPVATYLRYCLVSGILAELNCVPHKSKLST